MIQKYIFLVMPSCKIFYWVETVIGGLRPVTGLKGVGVNMCMQFPGCAFCKYSTFPYFLTSCTGGVVGSILNRSALFVFLCVFFVNILIRFLSC